jgi:hypothetical protein
MRFKAGLFLALIIIVFASTRSFGLQLCTANSPLSLSPTSETVQSANSSVGQFQLSTNFACSWLASTSAPWIHLSLTNGSGSQPTYQYSVDGDNDLCPRVGTINFRLTDVGENASATETVTQSGVAGDFSISVSPGTRTVLQGGTTSYSVSIGRTGSFSGSITLSTSALPSGVSASFTNVGFTSATLNLTAAANAALGIFGFTVNGVNTCQTRTSSSASIRVVGLPTQASYYTGNDGHIHEIALINNGVVNTDVSALTGSIPAAPSGGLSTIKNGTSHTVFFVGTDQSIYELVWTVGTWSITNLTSITNNTHAAINSPLSSFITPSGGINVFYLGAADQHLYQLNFNGSVWNNGDLTGGGRGVTASLSGGLSSFLAPSGAYNVFYVGTDQDVHQMNWNLTSLQDANVTQLGKGVLALTTSSLSSFLAPSGAYNIFYIGTDQNVHQLNWNLQLFHDANVTSLGHGFTALTTSGLSSFLASSGGYNIYYVGVDQDLHQLGWNLQSFADGNLTNITGAPLAATTGGLSSFINVTSGGFNVYYLASGTEDVIQVNFNGTSLTKADLITLGGGAAAAIGSSLSSYLQ